jgi:uncharacterized protein YjbJ (UPF0337 family)
MNWRQVEGKWTQLKGDAKSRWARLTDDDIKAVGGQFDRLVGKVMERYGMKKEQAHKDIAEWVDNVTARLDAAGDDGDRPAGTAPSPRHGAQR